jgi:tetratricopeptide (TPR) repeat protein
MPIQPRHTLAPARPRAVRRFTDREDFISAFKTAFLTGPRDQPRVLAYYGVGGIGKTTLRKELSRIAEVLRPGTVQTALDFDVANYRDQETALFVMRKDLLDKYKIQFAAFDIAYAVYWQRTHPQTPLAKSGIPMLDSSSALADLISAAGDIPFVGLVPKIALLSYKVGGSLHKWWTRRGHEELAGLPEFEPNEIAERLPLYWSASLRDHLADKGLPAVIFLDTYEALWEGERAEGIYHLRDEWVRELIAQLPEVLWVVCGRERLRWEEVDADWSACLNQHLVGGLADSDARSLLDSCDVSAPAIQQAIIEGSKGMPYYIDLAVDTYVTIKDREKREPEPADFARTPREVFARFLRHLTLPETETLKVLSAPRFWDYDLFDMLVKQYHTGYSLTSFSDLCRFSFISQESQLEAPNTQRPTPNTQFPDSRVFRMHHVMRDSLQEYQAPDLNQRVHRFLFDYYTSRLDGIDVRSITDRHRIALGEAFYHGRMVLSAPALRQWLTPIAAEFEAGAQWRLLVPLYEETVQLLREPPPATPESAFHSHSPDLASALHFLAGLYRILGQYAESEAAYRESLAIREQILAPDSLDLADSLSDFGLLLSDQGKYLEAEPLERRALEIREKNLGREHSDVARSLNNLGRLYWYLGHYDDAELLFQRALAIDEKLLGPDNVVIAERLNNLAMLHHIQGECTEAEPLYRRALQINERVLGPDHPEMAVSLNNLAGLYYSVGRLADAEPLMKQALEIDQKVLGADHPNVALSLNNLAGLLRDQGRYGEAEKLYHEAIAIYERALGTEHPDVAKSLNSLATLYRTARRFEEAEQLFRRALNGIENALGADHPEAARSLNGLAQVYSDQGRYPEAEPLYRRALAINEKVLGSEHADLAEGLDNLARTCRQTGNDAEAITLADRALKLRAAVSD